MQAKIIQVIEVSEFEPNQVKDKRSYFLPDGTKLVQVGQFSPPLAAGGIYSWPAENGIVSGGICLGSGNVVQTNS